MSHVRLLLVSGTSLVGQNVLASLAGRRGEVAVEATGSVARDLALFDFDAVHLVPESAAGGDAFELRLETIVDAARPDLVIPCRDDDVVALARLGGRRRDLAGRFLCGAAAVAEEIGDKLRSARFAERHGLPYVPSAAGGLGADLAGFVREHGFPLVVKPRAGCASRGVVIALEREALERAAAQPGTVVQPFLGDPAPLLAHRDAAAAGALPLFHSFEGTKRAGQAMIAPSGEVAALQCTRNAMRYGHSVVVTLDEDPEIARIARSCAEAASADGWRGPFNVQCLAARDGRLVVHEFNGRLTGATAAQALLGLDDLGIAIERFTGRRIAEAPAPSPRLRDVVKHPRSFAADPGRVDAILRDGTWRRGV